MALARWERPVQDEAGNLVTTGMCEVRREDVASNPLAVLYSDRAGSVGLGNPFAFSDGEPAFHAIGGSYRVRVYGAGFDKTYNYQPVGTGAETDSDELLIPGYLFEFEIATTAPPAAGSIRANNADLSLATRLFIWKSTIAGSDVSARILALNGKRILITSTNAGEQVSYQVNLVTDQTTYFELVVASPVGVTSLPASRVGVQREGEVGPAGANGVFNGIEVVLTGASETLLAAQNGNTIICNRTGAMTLAIQAAATCGSTYAVILKNTGTADVTIDPNGAETIDGATTATLKPGEAVILSSNGTVFRTFMRAYIPGGADVAIADGGTGSSTALGAIENLGVPSALANYLSGLTLSNNGAIPATRVDLAPGVAMDSANSKVLKLNATLTKRIDAAWAVGSGNGGLDTGTVATNTWYYMYLIGRSDTGVIDAIFSLSPTSPTMPANYDLKRYVGPVLYETSAIRLFFQDGDNFYFDTPIQNVNGSPASTAAQTLVPTVPTGRIVTAILSFAASSGAISGGVGYGLITAIRQTNTAASASAFSLMWLDSANNFGGGSTIVAVQTNASGQVRYRISVAAATVRILTLGFTDNRGR